ncbi:MAG: phosphopantothenoylcysteine decarboxylase [Pirellulales bacterium]|nr:phosphopantothenoylcysteine decarboxylase [Pirellulales bacterium]
MQGRKLLIGVTGGVAAYKTAALVSKLVQNGADVTVVLTDSARQFIGASTFEALTGRPVPRNMFCEGDFPLGAHIELARRAEVLCIAPATANFLAKAAVGLADDLLSTLYLAFDGPVVMAPAMNSQMWAKSPVGRSLAQLLADGVKIVDPEDGWLSCRDHGKGRMADPEKIRAAIDAALKQTQ